MLTPELRGLFGGSPHPPHHPPTEATILKLGGHAVIQAQ
jgi:hypothetical protein